MPSKDQIVLAIEIAGRAAASKEVKELRQDVRGIGPDTKKSGAQADTALGKVQRQVRKTGDEGDSAFRKFSRGARRSGSEVENAVPKFQKAANPVASLAKKAAAAGAAFVSLQAANQSVDAVEELTSSVMSLSGNFGLTERQAGRWAGIAKVRNLAPKALNQSFGTLAKNVSAVAPAVDKQHAAMSKLSRQQQQKLQDAQNIGNAQKREAAIAKVLASGDAKRGELSAKSLGKQAEALQKFGISASEARGANKDMYGFLLKVADGYEKLGPGTNRSALAMSLFGKGWQTLRPLLSKGAEGLKEQLDAVDTAGANVAGKGAKAAADLAVAQRKQKLDMLGIQVQLGTALIPLYSKFAETTLDLSKKANKAWPSIKKEIGPVVDSTLKVAEMTAKFVEKHPELLKIAAGFVAVATAARGLKLAGQVTGLNTVLKLLWKMRASSAAASAAGAAAGPAYASAAGRTAGANIGPEMQKRSGRFRRAGAALGKLMGVSAGERAASNAGRSVGANIGPEADKRAGRFRRAGSALGKVMGVAAAAVMVNELLHESGAGVQDIIPKLRDGISGKGAPGTNFSSDVKATPGAKKAQKKANTGPDGALEKQLADAQARMYNSTGFSIGAAAAEVDRLQKEIAARKRRRARAKKRATGGVVQRGELTRMNEQGSELAVLPAGTQVLTAGHPWSRAAASTAQHQATTGPTGGRRGGAGVDDRRVIVNRIYLDSKVLYEALSDETERQALKR